MKFIELFKEHLEIFLKKKDANFNTEGFFRKILQDNLVLTYVKPNESEEFLNKLNIMQNDEIMEFVIGVLSQKIVKIEEENLVLKAELEESRTNEKSLNEKINKINEKLLEFDEKLKNLCEDSDEMLKNQKKLNNETTEKININMKDIREEINQKIKKMEDKFIVELEGRTKKIEEFVFDNYYSFCPENNYTNFTLSNLNRTLERTSGDSDVRGFRCEN